MELANQINKLELEFFKRIRKYREFSQSMNIDSPEKHSEADHMVREGQRLKAGIKEKVDPIVKQRHSAHKEATRFRKKCLDPIEEGQKEITGKMEAYKKKAIQEAAKERERLESEARLAHEAACLKQAAELEAEGAPKESIEAVLDYAEDLQPEIYVPEYDLRSKTKFDPAWEIEVVDEFAVPEEYIVRTVNTKAIKEIVKSKKGNIKIPGIKILTTTKTRRYK